MPSWISTILLAGATSLFIGFFITPRLEARNRRVRIAHEARDEFSRQVLTILSACGRLRESEVPPTLAEQRPASAEKMNAERQRWLDQLDEATRYLAEADSDAAQRILRRVRPRHAPLHIDAVHFVDVTAQTGAQSKTVTWDRLATISLGGRK